jgi:hypothetical protein
MVCICNQIGTNWTILKKISKAFKAFLVKKLRSGSGTIIPDLDPTWQKKFRIRQDPDPQRCDL